MGAGDSGVAHPELLAGPAFFLRAGPHRLAKQGPLRAEGCALRIRQVRRHVPPLDAKIGVRAVIGRESKTLAGSDGGESFRALAEPGKALRSRAIGAEPESDGAAEKGATGYRGVTAHRRRS